MKKQAKPTMQAVHKFQIAPTVEMPEGAAILKVDFDASIPAVCVWALVNPEAKMETRFFAMAKTGEALSPQIADCPHLETLVAMIPTDDGKVKAQVTHVWEVPAYVAKRKA